MLKYITKFYMKNETKNNHEATNAGTDAGSVDFNYNAACNLLKEKEFTIGEIIKIRKAFSDWGKGFDENIEHNHKHNTYSSKKRKGYGFRKEEEVRFFNAIIDFSPNSDTEKIIQVMGIVMKLLDIESEWSFRGNS